MTLTPDRFVTQQEWGAAGPRATQTIPGPVRGVTLHWMGPRVGWPWPHSDCARKVRAIERYHQINNGWSDIAYNLVVCPHSYVFEGRGAGIRPAANGISGIGSNDQWYAVCYMGGQGDEFTALAKTGMLDAVEYLRTHARPAGPVINGHRDHHATECPGATIYAWIQAGTPIEEDDMVTQRDKEDIADLVVERLMRHRLDVIGEVDQTRRFDVMVRQTHFRALGARQAASDDPKVLTVEEIKTAVTEALSESTTGSALTVEQVDAAAESALRRVMGGLDE